MASVMLETCDAGDDAGETRPSPESLRRTARGGDPDPPRVSKMTTSNNILKHQMILAEKVMNIKVVELIKIYNFYFDHFFIRQSGSNIVHKIYISLIDDM